MAITQGIIDPTIGYGKNPNFPYVFMTIGTGDGALNITTSDGGAVTQYSEVNIGGKFIWPTHLQQFTITKKADQDSHGEGSITLFDPQWMKLETLLRNALSSEPLLQLQYGYYNGIVSKVFQCHIVTVTPEIVTDGVNLTITFKPSGTVASQANLVKTRSFGDNKTVSEIVEELCEINGWKTQTKNGNKTIEPTQPLFTRSDFYTTDEVVETISQQNMDDFQFIKHVLAPLAVSKDEGLGNYQARLETERDGNPSDGKREAPIFHFKPLNSQNTNNDTTIREYTFLRDKRSPVISFTPENVDQSRLKLGDGSVKLSYEDMFTGDWLTEAVSKANIRDEQFTASMQTFLQLFTGDFINSAVLGNVLNEFEQKLDPRVKSGTTSVVQPANNSQMAQTLVKTQLFPQYDSLITASMEIIGDPTIVPQDYISVQIPTPSGKPYFPSGFYRVLEINDSISAGTFTTSLSLYADGSGGEIE